MSLLSYTFFTLATKLFDIIQEKTFTGKLNWDFKRGMAMEKGLPQLPFILLF